MRDEFRPPFERLDPECGRVFGDGAVHEIAVAYALHAGGLGEGGGDGEVEVGGDGGVEGGEDVGDDVHLG